MQIENSLANAIVEKMNSNGEVFIPRTLEIGKDLHFAIDNADLKNDTPDGKGEFHGTVLVAFQKNPSKVKQHLQLSSNYKTHTRFLKKPLTNLTHRMNLALVLGHKSTL